jgi:hypothetical protein
LARGTGEGDPHTTLISRSDGFGEILDSKDLTQHLPCRNQQPAPRVCQCNAARTPFEQLEAQAVFELSDTRTEWRLGHVKLRRCPAEMQFLSNDDEGLKVFDFHGLTFLNGFSMIILFCGSFYL